MIGKGKRGCDDVIDEKMEAFVLSFLNDLNKHT